VVLGSRGGGRKSGNGGEKKKKRFSGFKNRDFFGNHNAIFFRGRRGFFAPPPWVVLPRALGGFWASVWGAGGGGDLDGAILGQ